MQFFFVGLAMRSRVHDYGPVHAALFSMQARRVSVRIWLCAVEATDGDRMLTRLGESLGDDDEMLVVEVPRHLRGPRPVRIAA